MFFIQFMEVQFVCFTFVQLLQLLFLHEFTGIVLLLKSSFWNTTPLFFSSFWRPLYLLSYFFHMLHVLCVLLFPSLNIWWLVLNDSDIFYRQLHILRFGTINVNLVHLDSAGRMLPLFLRDFHLLILLSLLKGKHRLCESDIQVFMTTCMSFTLFLPFVEIVSVVVLLDELEQVPLHPVSLLPWLELVVGGNQE